MKLVDANEPVDDPVRPMHDLANQRIFEFRNCSARFREWDQSICSRNEAGDNDRRIVRCVLADERANRGQVGTRLLRPENNPSRQELFLDLVVGHELAGVRLTETFFDLRDEAQSLDGVLDRGVFGQGPKCLDGSLLLGDFHLHDSTIVKLSLRLAVSPITAAHQRRPLTVVSNPRIRRAAAGWCSPC